MKRVFRPGLAVSLLALAGVAATVSLGNWQTRRAEEKLARQALLESRQGTALAMPTQAVAAADYEWARVAARGEFVPRHTVLLDNKLLQGRAGYHVLTPLKLEGGGMHLLVDRGWIAAGPSREVLPKIETPAGPQTLEGIAVIPSSRFVELGSDTQSGPVWQNLTLARFRQWSELDLQPVVLQQTSDSKDGLARVWDRPDLGIDKHRGYALQWYSFAILIFILYVALNFRPRKSQA
jgi:surfeit locus 1 family protein